jgi:hypothetical protein
MANPIPLAAPVTAITFPANWVVTIQSSLILVAGYGLRVKKPKLFTNNL